MRLRYVILLALTVAFAVSACSANPPTDESPTNNDYYQVVSLSDYRFSVAHPEKGWELVFNLPQQKRWKEKISEAEYEIFVLDGNLNTYNFRIDKMGGWTVHGQQELYYDQLPCPIVFSHASRLDKSNQEIGALQLYFSRSDGLDQPIYYLITLRNYDFTKDDEYREVFSEIINSLLFKLE